MCSAIKGNTPVLVDNVLSRRHGSYFKHTFIIYKRNNNCRERVLSDLTQLIVEKCNIFKNCHFFGGFTSGGSHFVHKTIRNCRKKQIYLNVFNFFISFEPIDQWKICLFVRHLSSFIWCEERPNRTFPALDMILDVNKGREYEKIIGKNNSN